MFLPPSKNLTRYFRYNGSLTTPDCAEAVVWTVFENAIPLSRDQVFMMSRKWESYIISTIYNLNNLICICIKVEKTLDLCYCLMQLLH